MMFECIYRVSGPEEASRELELLTDNSLNPVSFPISTKPPSCLVQAVVFNMFWISSPVPKSDTARERRIHVEEERR